MIPLFHDFEGKRVLVFGGGPVGARRARRFAREAAVVVVAPAFADADFGAASRCRAAPTPDEVPAWVDRADPTLVVAATDDGAVNDAVAAAARERGLLVNRADRAETGGARDVVVPATARDGPVVAAVGTGGRAPTLSAHLRADLETAVSGAGPMADLLAECRAALDEEGTPPDRRRAVLASVVDSAAVWDALEAGDADRARRTVRVLRDELD